MESKNEKFTRLATQRVNKTLDEMRKLTNLISPSYASSQEERHKIINALRTAVEELEYVFSGEKVNKKSFSFGDVESSEDETNDEK